MAEKTSFNNLINSEKPVVIDFYADWCGPCKMMAPIFLQLAGRMQDKVRVIKIDVDRNQELSMKYQIRSIPTIMIFQRGKLLWQHVGTATLAQLEQAIQQHTEPG